MDASQNKRFARSMVSPYLLNGFRKNNELVAFHGSACVCQTKSSLVALDAESHLRGTAKGKVVGRSAAHLDGDPIF
ncbi:MAG: hypothetical protein BGO12_20535 [Verrucomicrobia bacterium 61-8]|nr:MAG: hypothetical protein BGO12_20535 [Verrucomicrobia bacterium 61-8]